MNAPALDANRIVVAPQDGHLATAQRTYSKRFYRRVGALFAHSIAIKAKKCVSCTKGNRA